MVVYWITFCALFLCAYLDKFYKKFSRYRYLCLAITFIWFFILSTFRWQVGTDWEAYYNFFQHVEPSLKNIPTTFEIGYTLLNIVVKRIFNNYTVFLALIAFITLICEFTAIKRITVINSLYVDKKEQNSDIFLILFCVWAIYLGNIFPVRRTIASSICLLALFYCHKKKLFKFVICVILATLVHRTALIFILAYPIYHLKIQTKNLVLITAILSIFGIICSRNLLLLLSRLMKGTAYSDRILIYISHGSNEQYGSVFSTFFFVLKGAINIIGLLILILISSRYNENNKSFKGCANVYCFGSILFISFIGINITFASLGNIYTQTQIFLLPTIFKCFKRAKSQKIVFILMAVYLLLRFIINLNAYDSGVIFPYRTIFGGGN